MKMILLFVLLLAGCATSSEVYLPSGTKGYVVNCNGSLNSVSTCFEKAGELCGAKGYVLLNKEGEAHMQGTSFGSASANHYNAQAVQVSQFGAYVSRSMLVRCNDK